MEVSPACGPNMMADELSRVRKLVMQLFESRTSPMEISGSVEQEILSSIDKAMAMAVSKGFDGSRQLPACSPNAGGACTDSPRSASGSPRSDNSDRTFKDHENRDNCKKRKTQTKWTSQVRLGSGEGVEGPLDDGYSWRKYGQKDILGAKYPRGYYRCTHRNSQGCLAMKQVQRSDDNPSVFDVTYRGTHTCHRRTPPPRDQSQNQHQHQLLLSFQAGLKVKTEGLDSESRDPAPPSFSFPSTTLGSMMSENHIFSSSSTLDSCFKGSFSPSFISPATSESNYFSVSPCRMSSYGGPKVHTSHEYDFTEIVSAETSATNSPMLDMDFLLEQVDLDPDFPFDSCSFFS